MSCFKPLNAKLRTGAVVVPPFVTSTVGVPVVSDTDAVADTSGVVPTSPLSPFAPVSPLSPLSPFSPFSPRMLGVVYDVPSVKVK
jgi:hypothetical protein